MSLKSKQIFNDYLKKTEVKFILYLPSIQNGMRQQPSHRIGKETLNNNLKANFNEKNKHIFNYVNKNS